MLILDEPTNHLDMQSKEVLKQALKNYEGTFIVVSHDREFLDGLTNRIWDIENKHLKIHHFTVQEYLKRKSDAFTKKDGPKQKEEARIEAERQKEVVKNTLSYADQKELKRLHNKTKNGVSRAEDNITRLENEIEKMNVLIASLDYSDKAPANEQLAKYEALKHELDQTMTEWENLNNELIDLESKVS